MKATKMSLLVLAVFASGAVFADKLSADTLKTLGSKSCLACHTVDNKLVGPAFKDVAAKYKDDKDALNKLANRVVKGSTGVWGPIPMPPNAAINLDEAKELVAAILKLN